jgi:hypothetical protein
VEKDTLIMARQYRVSFFRYSLLIVFFALAGFKAGPARAQDDSILTVTGVKADATAASAVEARQQAFEKAQVDAFTQLASRFMSEDQMKTFQPPPVMEITLLVDDFEITQEQLSAVRYVGTYTFRFKKGATQGWFASHSAMPPIANTGMMPPQDPAMAGAMPSQPMTTVPVSSLDGVFVPTPAGNSLRARIRFAGLPQWMQAQKTLQRIPGVTGIDLSSLKPNEAMVNLRYQGSPDILRQSFAQAGMALTETGQPGLYDIGAASPQFYGQPR